MEVQSKREESKNQPNKISTKPDEVIQETENNVFLTWKGEFLFPPIGTNIVKFKGLEVQGLQDGGNGELSMTQTFCGLCGYGMPSNDSPNVLTQHLGRNHTMEYSNDYYVLAEDEEICNDMDEVHIDNIHEKEGKQDSDRLSPEPMHVLGLPKWEGEFLFLPLKNSSKAFRLQEG